MSLKNRVANQMVFSVYYLRYPWMIAFLLIPIFTLTYGYFTIFIITALILISSTYLFVTLSKHKVQVLEEEQSLQEDEPTFFSSYSVKNGTTLDTYSPESYSDSEITSEEGSEFDFWQFPGEACQITDCSDGTISDEDSLIEIALPGGHYKEEEPQSCFQQLLPSETVFRWPEMNEEENLIEIDIFMGSIKCSRFEIKE